MTIKNKIAAIAVPAMLIAAPVMAATTGQLSGGDNYLAKNITKNGAYTNTVSAGNCDVVQFKVRIHNVGPNAVSNVNVKATLPSGVATSHSSTMNVSSVDSNPNTRTDTAGVNLSNAQSIAYVPGSTELLDANSVKMSTLPETLFTSGVSIGTVGVSLQQKRFVQFQAKVNCPTTVTEKPAPTPEQPEVVTPTALPETGPVAGLAAAAGASAMGYAAMAYRRSKQVIAEKLLEVK